MQVDAAGFTLAPLQPQYRSSGSNISQSCLVTFVLKVDLGGFLSEKSVAGMLLPWSRQIGETFLHSMLTSIMALRDTVSSFSIIDAPNTYCAPCLLHIAIQQPAFFSPCTFVPNKYYLSVVQICCPAVFLCPS